MSGVRNDSGRRVTRRTGREGRSGLSPGVTRVTVNLTPRSVTALQGACHRTGANKTDTINHALQVLAVVHELLERNDGRSLVVMQPDGRSERIYLL